MKKNLTLLVLVFLLGLTGCASDLMQPAEPESMTTTLAPNEAAIVFFRSSFVGGAVQAPVVDATNGKLKYIGIVSSGTKIRHKTTPGKHQYLVGGESSELLEADLEGGKTYYTYISPRIGLMKARFVFVPVTKEDQVTDSFKSDLAGCAWHSSKPEGESWFQENRPDMESKYGEALEQHRSAPPEEKKIIRAQDGINVPLK